MKLLINFFYISQTYLLNELLLVVILRISAEFIVFRSDFIELIIKLN